MRDPERIGKIVSKLATLWAMEPDMRLGQLLENFIFVSGKRGDKTSVALFYQEDDKTLKRFEGYIEIKMMALKAASLNRQRSSEESK